MRLLLGRLLLARRCRARTHVAQASLELGEVGFERRRLTVGRIERLLRLRQRKRLDTRGELFVADIRLKGFELLLGLGDALRPALTGILEACCRGRAGGGGLEMSQRRAQQRERLIANARRDVRARFEFCDARLGPLDRALGRNRGLVLGLGRRSCGRIGGRCGPIWRGRSIRCGRRSRRSRSRRRRCARNRCAGSRRCGWGLRRRGSGNRCWNRGGCGSRSRCLLGGRLLGRRGLLRCRVNRLLRRLSECPRWGGGQSQQQSAACNDRTGESHHGCRNSLVGAEQAHRFGGDLTAGHRKNASTPTADSYLLRQSGFYAASCTRRGRSGAA